jgi:hypothetical protein
MSAEVAQHAFGQSLAERRQHRVPRALLERDVVDAGSGAGALPLALQAGDAPAALAVAGGRVEPVDLGESQLGDTYQNSPSVGSALGGFSASINRAAREAAKAACGRCTRGKKRITFGISDMLSTNVTTQPGLFSLGQSSGLRAGASCNVTVDCTTGVYSYICDAGLNLKDDFTDPLDGDRIIGRPFDLPGSTPYPITYSFKVRRSGGGAIPR